MKIGEIYTEKIIFSKRDILEFAKLSGDFNPLHVDEEYAKYSLFKGIVVHGFLAASVFTKILGTVFPGKGTIYISQDLHFLAPVFPDKEYNASIEVLETIKEKHNAIVLTELRDVDSKLCITGKAKIKNVRAI